jgi:hypothetical protein
VDEAFAGPRAADPAHRPPWPRGCALLGGIRRSEALVEAAVAGALGGGRRRAEQVLGGGKSEPDAAGGGARGQEVLRRW